MLDFAKAGIEQRGTNAQVELRLGRIERRLDGMDAKLDQIVAALARVTPQAGP